MEKSLTVMALFVSAMCFSFALARKTPANESFVVKGKIYCDPCRFEIETRLSSPLAGNNHWTHFFAFFFIGNYRNHDI